MVEEATEVEATEVEATEVEATAGLKEVLVGMVESSVDLGARAVGTAGTETRGAEAVGKEASTPRMGRMVGRESGPQLILKIATSTLLLRLSHRLATRESMRSDGATAKRWQCKTSM
eukprot:5910648-Pleurochrysis_carterae.AAC.1